jgi:hypothetical protein
MTNGRQPIPQVFLLDEIQPLFGPLLLFHEVT